MLLKYAGFLFVCFCLKTCILFNFITFSPLAESISGHDELILGQKYRASIVLLKCFLIV